MVDPTRRPSEVGHKGSIRGDWYLGVVKGSPDLIRARTALKSLTSVTANWNLLRSEIGLPADATYLDKPYQSSPPRTFLDDYQQTVSRDWIRHYSEVWTYLIYQFRRIFTRWPSRENGKPGAPPADIGPILREIQQEVDKHPKLGHRPGSAPP